MLANHAALVSNMMKPLALGILLFGSLMLLPSASASHVTYCSGELYDPVTGDEVVERCYTRYQYQTGCWSNRYFYMVAGFSVSEKTTYSCDGEYWTCYGNLVYADTSPIRAGVC